MRRVGVAMGMFVLVLGCTSTHPPPPKGPTPAAPAPVELSAAVHWVRDSAEYRALVVETFSQALAAVERRAAGKAPGTWAVALDADETVLDNSGYAKEGEEHHAGHTELAWAAWVRRQERPALPGASHFLHAVRDLGGKIAIVTNTIQELCDDTEANMKSADLPYDIMLCRSLTGDRRKESRWQKVSDGTAKAGMPPLEIVAWVGDNIQDFPGQSQDLRNQPESAFADFGERFFLLPNPVYGSWEGNPQR